MRVLVVIPAWNEGDSLFRTITDVENSGPWDVLVIDDGSAYDWTASVDDCRRWPSSKILRMHHFGVGAAIRTGIKYAMLHNYDIVVFVNAKGKTPARCIPSLVAMIEAGYDLAQGSRYRGNGVNTPWHRRVGHWLHSRLFSLVTGRRITDSTSGFRAVRVSMLRDPRFVCLDQEWLNGYALEPYLMRKAIEFGYAVREVPVDIVYPKTGKYTSMRIRDWWTICKPLWRK